MAVEMELARILIRETDDPQVLELREKGGARVFPIVIGLVEAAAIERRLMGDVPPRPQTHELLASVLQGLEVKLEKVVISELRHDPYGNGTFFARLYLRKADGEVIDIDSRPSDAIALGVGEEAPIFVEEDVLDEVCRPEE